VNSSTGGIAASGTGNIEGSWRPASDTVWRCKLIGQNGVPANKTRNNVSIPGDPTCPNADPELMLHQCMLVTLSGSGQSFLQSSAYRNMDLVKASPRSSKRSRCARPIPSTALQT
jgi:hypothetical protein